MTRLHFRTAVLGLILGLVPTTFAANFDLSWFTIDGGGAMFSTGGTFELSGTIGQPDAGPLASGTFELAGGFWAATTTAPPPQCVAADANCDTFVDAEDIDPFFIAVGDAAAWQAQYSCDFLCANDVDGSGGVDSEDIDPFFICLGAGGCP